MLDYLHQTVWQSQLYQHFSFNEGQKRLLSVKLALPEIQKQHS